MKIATWNVNSIRARIPNFLAWVERDKPDIILVQELKCTEEQFPYEELDNLNYNIKVVGQKARNGVAIFSKYPLYDIQTFLPLYGLIEEDNDARYIEACIDYEGKVVKIASIYVPNGSPSAIESEGLKDITDTETFRKKMKFYERLRKKFQESMKENEIAIFGGDYNVCPNLYIDVYSPKKDGDITCTHQEREKFKNFLDDGISDIWRSLNPKLQEYTWWGYRPSYMWERNLGFRLDAFMLTPEAVKLIKSCNIIKDIRGREKPSDHVPMVCEI